jgi:hypothetical protein
MCVCATSRYSEVLLLRTVSVPQVRGVHSFDPRPVAALARAIFGVVVAYHLIQAIRSEPVAPVIFAVRFVLAVEHRDVVFCRRARGVGMGQCHVRKGHVWARGERTSGLVRIAAIVSNFRAASHAPPTK